MAIKPTIYKCRISLSDLNRDYYDSLNLTVAQHPSETLNRMMVRVLAYCLNAQEGLAFTKGLSAIEEPDIWLRTLDDQTQLWIEIGEPDPDRIKKASHIAQTVMVYTFNSKSKDWWAKTEPKLSSLNVSVIQFVPDEVSALAALVQRTMDFSVTISGDTLYISTALGECELLYTVLRQQAQD